MRLRRAIRFPAVLAVGAVLGGTALVQSTVMWQCAVVLAVAAILLAGVLQAVYRRGAGRAYWIGFAIFGWGFLILVFGPIAPIYGPPGALEDPSTSALSEGVIEPLFKAIHLRGMNRWTPDGAAPSFPPLRFGSARSVQNFRIIGNFLLAMVFALAGGAISRALYATREGRDGG